MFDWITWSIWLAGFIILVVWVVVPYREFKGILRKQRSSQNEGGS